MLTNLQLKDFRCFESLATELGEGFNFFVGANGEGKTSILEAVCVLLRLQSQRSSSLGPLVRAGTKVFSLRGTFDGHTLDFRYGGLRRTLGFDKIEQRTVAEYLRLARVVSLANADIEMTRSSSEPRRRYLDFLGSQIEPHYRPSLRAYERALRARNALLKSPRPRPREIAAYDAPLLRNGAVLREMRLRLAERLAPVVVEAHAAISQAKEKVGLSFAPGNEEDFAAHLERSRAEETRLRQTVVGPHRDDIDLFLAGRAVQNFASEGQQRTLALAMKIAQARIFAEEGAAPLLLIDDIFGELDPARRNALLAALPPETQKLVTVTTLQWRDEFATGQIFDLRDHQLVRR